MNARNHSRRDFLQALLAGTAALGLPGCAQTGTGEETETERGPRPNVILIMTDDQGYGDLGVTGNPVIRTPNIDAMARRSAQMESFYVSPVCSPTRACLMTGRYNYRTRCIDTYIGRSMMDPSEVTIAEILQEAGYGTGIFGKWHLGDNYPMRPNDNGFDEALVHRGGGIGQPSDPEGGEKKYTDAILFHNGEKVQTKGYCTDVYFDAAIDWIERCRAEDRNFFAYIPTNAPHGPFHDVPEELLAAYREIDLENSQFPQDEGHKLPAGCNVNQRARIFSMITNVDQNVGRLFGRLEELGLTENTIVIFMTDNGPNGRRYVAGMKGMKSQVHEGGIRSPFFVHWPAALRAGQSSDRIAAHIDVLPTILDACRIPLPAELEIDGRSLLPLLRGDDAPWSDRTIVIQSHRGDEPVLYHHFAARSQKWKLLHASGFGCERFLGEPRFELYNMVADPLEMKDLAAERPDIVESMCKTYREWFADVSTTRVENYAPPPIHVGTPHENPVVLTRQDWRHVTGQPWGWSSIGFWVLHVATAGSYDIRLRFRQAKTAGKATLEIGDQRLTGTFEKGATECVFEEVRLAEGAVRLMADLVLAKSDESSFDVIGPHKVDVFLR